MVNIFVCNVIRIDLRHWDLSHCIALWEKKAGAATSTLSYQTSSMVACMYNLRSILRKPYFCDAGIKREEVKLFEKRKKQKAEYRKVFVRIKVNFLMTDLGKEAHDRCLPGSIHSLLWLYDNEVWRDDLITDLVAFCKGPRRNDWKSFVYKPSHLQGICPSSFQVKQVLYCQSLY